MRRRLDIERTEDVGTARRTVRGAMVGHSADALLAAELVVSELVTNALLHGEGMADVAVVPIDGGIRIEVTDGNQRGPWSRQPG